MIRNEQVLENFYGIENRFQKQLYDLFIESLDPKRDADVIMFFEKLFKDNIEKYAKLEELKEKGSKLNEFYSASIRKNEGTRIDGYLSSNSYRKQRESEELFFVDTQRYDETVVAIFVDIFYTVPVDSKKVQSFIESFRKTRIDIRQDFLRHYAMEHYPYGWGERDYLYGISSKIDEYDNMVRKVFGDEYFKKYSRLDPNRKAQFLMRFSQQIIKCYNQQVKSNYSYGAGLLRRKPVRCCKQVAYSR